MGTPVWTPIASVHTGLPTQRQPDVGTSLGGFLR